MQISLHAVFHYDDVVIYTFSSVHWRVTFACSFIPLIVLIWQFNKKLKREIYHYNIVYLFTHFAYMIFL